jgi:hypothetical protein
MMGAVHHPGWRLRPSPRRHGSAAPCPVPSAGALGCHERHSQFRGQGMGGAYATGRSDIRNPATCLHRSRFVRVRSSPSRIRRIRHISVISHDGFLLHEVSMSSGMPLIARSYPSEGSVPFHPPGPGNSTANGVASWRQPLPQTRMACLLLVTPPACQIV